MGNERGTGGVTVSARLLRGASAFAVLAVLAASPATPLKAQDLEDIGGQFNTGNEQMLLEADELIYDHDAQLVTAAGSVRIDYGGNRLVADSVSYNQRTARLTARGNVQIVDRQGTKIDAQEIDVTDDFRDGFVNALRVETAEKAYFLAESGERRDGTVTTFNNGLYTACEPCEDKPSKAPIWQIKSRKIIWNGQKKTVRFEGASFELFGLPIAWFPFFEIADPTVKRKSGFLFPSAGYSKELGVNVTVPYYFALSPTYDLTVWGRGYTRQGFLGEAEWRQRFESGSYTLKVAGIHQQDPSAFDSRHVDSMVKGRAMVGSKGRFQINPRWVFGWDVLAQTDPNFSRTYDIGGYDDYRRTNEVYLTGLNDRNFFDLRFQKYQIQELLPQTSTGAQDPKQPWVLPTVDYSYTVADPVLGGELSFDANARVIHRDNRDAQLVRNPFAPPAAILGAMRGVDGWNSRVSVETEWKRNLIAPGGVVFTPILHARSDLIGVDTSTASQTAIGTLATNLNGPFGVYSHDGSAYSGVMADIRSSYYRAMATAGLEVRWPVLFSTASATHVLEPMAQILVRPDAPYSNSLGIPNEDAQSLVFDATTLFERDKFSGWDRIEGGTRANVGIRYTGSFANGWSAHGLFGQSYHLAGDNPFASPDLVNVGAFSGLETDVSDFVGMVGVAAPSDFTFSVGGRFDEKTFEIRRAETRATAKLGDLNIMGRYAFIQAQPLYGFPADRREVGGAAQLQLDANWSVFGAANYDLESRTLARTAIGFEYDDECFTYGMTFIRTQNSVTRETDLDIAFKVTLRTIGDFGSSTTSVDGFE